MIPIRMSVSIFGLRFLKIWMMKFPMKTAVASFVSGLSIFRARSMI